MTANRQFFPQYADRSHKRMPDEKQGTGRKLLSLYTDPFVWASIILSLALMSLVHTFVGFAFLVVSLVGYMIYKGGFL